MYDIESGILIHHILDRAAEDDSARNRWNNGYEIRGSNNSSFSEAGLEGGNGSIHWIDGLLFQVHTKDMLQGTFVIVSRDHDKRVAFMSVSN